MPRIPDGPVWMIERRYQIEDGMSVPIRSIAAGATKAKAKKTANLNCELALQHLTDGNPPNGSWDGDATFLYRIQ